MINDRCCKRRASSEYERLRGAILRVWLDVSGHSRCKRRRALRRKRGERLQKRLRMLHKREEASERWEEPPHTNTFLCTRTAGAEPTCDDKHPPTHVGETATPQNSPPMRRKRQESPHKSIRTSIPPGDAETEQHGHNGPPTHATRQSRGQPSQLRTVGRAKLHRPENMNCALSKATCWTPKRNTPRWRRILWAPPLQ